MAEMYIDNFQCGECGFNHDTKAAASECHKAVVKRTYECEICHRIHGRAQSAIHCCELSEEVEEKVKKEVSTNGHRPQAVAVAEAKPIVPEVVSPARRKVKIGVSDLREHLFATIEALQDPESGMDIEKAKAITSTAQTIINLQKVELDYLREIGGIMGSGFVPMTQEEYTAIKKRNLGD